jgi:TPR repeat protein
MSTLGIILVSPFRVIFLAATIFTLFVSSSLSADIKTLRKQAEAGDANAQFNIGSIYENGSGVRQDYAEAARWYRKAAERGDVRAQYNLGILNQNGWGVPQDYKEALKWYRKAAMQGAVSAQYNLGFMYLNGQGVPQNYAEAAKWYRKAAEQGDVDALRILGLAYYLGKWVPQDFVQSYFWFSLAASRASGEEYKQASEAKDRIAKELTPEKLKEAQRMVREWEKSHPRKGGFFPQSRIETELLGLAYLDLLNRRISPSPDGSRFTLPEQPLAEHHEDRLPELVLIESVSDSPSG